MILSASPAADKPGFIAALFPKQIQGQLSVGVVFVPGETKYYPGGIFFKAARAVKRIHIPDDPVGLEARIFRGNQARISCGNNIRSLNQTAAQTRPGALAADKSYTPHCPSFSRNVLL
jgi:hypothetical protein